MEFNEQLTNLEKTLKNDILDSFEWGQDKTVIIDFINERINDFIEHEELEEESDYYIEDLRKYLKQYIINA